MSTRINCCTPFLPRHCPGLALLFLLCFTFDGHTEDAVPAGRIFYASFDDSLAAESARGATSGQPFGKTSFVPGHSGEGLLTGDVDGPAGVSYDSKGNFDAERGTLAMWVKPVNWHGADPVHCLFFNVKIGERGTFLFYKYYSKAWGLTLFLHPDSDPRTKTYCTRPLDDWQPGQWHHIACSWTRLEGIRLYIGGELVKSLDGTALAFAGPAHGKLTLGGAWQRKGNRTVLDEVMIFKRMLATHEIAALAGRKTSPPPATQPYDIPGVSLAHAILGQKVLARVYRDALGAIQPDRATLTLSEPGKPEATVGVSLALEDGLNQLELELTAVPPGKYVARLDLMTGEKAAGSEFLKVSKETDDTWQSAAKIGTEDTVLPPFTPLEITGNEVRCYGRRYQFGPSGLLSQVVSAGQPLLAGPVRIEFQGPAGPFHFSPEKMAISASSPTQASVSGTLKSDTLEILVESLVRYEGTVWTTVRFRPQAKLRVQGLRVIVPLRAKEAPLFGWRAPSRIGDRGTGYGHLPEGQGQVWSSAFLPSLWIGNEFRGLGWFAESDEHWDFEGEDALTIDHSNNEVVFRLNVVRKPRTIDRSFSLKFGLQATPVRPLRPGWRAYQWVPSPDITRFFLHLRKRPYPRPELAGNRPRGKVAYLYTYHSHFTNTLPKDPGEFREMVDRVKGYGLFTVPYTDTTFQPEDAGDLWLRGRELRTRPNAVGSGYGRASAAACCHRGPYADWFVWYASHLVKHYGVNGIYLDDMWPYGCTNAAHGCGYTGPDGQRRRTYSLRARNETYRRIRAVFTATGRPFYMAYHISGALVPPLPTFGDGLLLGEDRYHRVRENPDYTATMTPQEWRAGYAATTWGIPTVFLPQFKMKSEWMKSEALAEKLVAALIPHDVQVWPIFANTETIMKYRSALLNFGIGSPSTRFLPYWKQTSRPLVASENVRVSAYLCSGRLLLCAANWSDRSIDAVQVHVDFRALGVPPAASARDALTGELIRRTGARITFALPARKLRLIEVE